MEKLIASEKGTGFGMPCLPSSCGLISGAIQTLWKLAEVAVPWVGSANGSRIWPRYFRACTPTDTDCGFPGLDLDPVFEHLLFSVSL